MNGSENVGGEAVPISLVAVETAASDLVSRIPTDDSQGGSSDDTDIDARSFSADETDTSDVETNPAALRAGDSGQTFAAVAERAASPEAFVAADADGD